MEIEKFIESLINLRIILEEIEKINVIENLEIIKMEEITENRAKIIRNKIDRRVRRAREKFEFCNNKKQIQGRPERPNSIDEELRLRKITRKKINEIEKLETEIKEMKRLRIEAMELKSSKLLGDFNMEKRIEIEEIMKIEMKLEKLKIPTTMINTIKKSIISEKCMHHILRHKRYCA